MSENELVKPGQFSLSPTNLAEAMQLADIMAASDMVPKDFKGNSGNVLVAVQMGAEIGLQPMQALQNIAVINGRPSIWGDAALAVVKGHPDFISIKETCDGESATCTIVRKNEEPHTSTFTKEDAILAKLWEKAGPWTQYPKRMLQMRARSFALRDVFPDALKGISIAEEARDIPVKNMGDIPIVDSAENEEEPIVDLMPDYPQEDFDRNFDKWLTLIEGGKKTADDIIAMVQTKGTLSEDMVSKIKSIKKAGE